MNILTTNINSQEIKAYWEEKSENTTLEYLGRAMFPETKQMDLSLSFIKGRTGAPVALKPSAYDANVVLRDRLPVETLATEIPFFKEAILVKEKERRDLLTLGARNPQMADIVLARIFNDNGELIRGAHVQAERMRMQLLTQGKIAIADENGVNLDYDYGFDSATQTVTLTGADTWDKATADPLQDLIDATMDMDNVELAIMNKVTWGHLLKSPSLANFLGKEVIVTQQMLRDYIRTEIGIEVVVYDKQYATELNGTVKKYVPDGVVSLTPKVVGQTVYSVTPEEIDMMAGGEADVSVVELAIAVTTIPNNDPMNVTTKVSQCVLPSFEQVDNIKILNVLE